MSVYVNYAYTAKCSEENLVGQLERLRRRFRELPFRRVGEVHHIDPAYQSLPLRELEKNGYPLPAAVKQRVEGLSSDHLDFCHLVAPPVMIGVPDEAQHKFFEPAVEFIETTDLWSESDLPEKIKIRFGLTYYRMAFELEFANVMFRHGYLLMVDPGEDCESFCVGLTSYRTIDSRMWLGSGSTKTLYASRFVKTHESICRALDMIQDEGLLLIASDTSGYYEHRDWSRSGNLLNEATAVVGITHGMLDRGAEAAREGGIMMQDLSDPATKNRNYIRAGKSDGMP